MNPIIVLVTASNLKEARSIASALVEKKLAACVNIVDKIESLFWWEQKVDRADEVLLILKSGKGKLPQIIRVVKSLHSYQVPEIIALPIIAGFKPYLKWINESLR